MKHPGMAAAGSSDSRAVESWHWKRGCAAARALSGSGIVP